MSVVTDEELRLLVREAIARHMPRAAAPHAAPSPVALVHQHASFAQFGLPKAGDADCVIEPMVRCTHCGFCKSYGH